MNPFFDQTARQQRITALTQRIIADRLDFAEIANEIAGETGWTDLVAVYLNGKKHMAEEQRLLDDLSSDLQQAPPGDLQDTLRDYSDGRRDLELARTRAAFDLGFNCGGATVSVSASRRPALERFMDMLQAYGVEGHGLTADGLSQTIDTLKRVVPIAKAHLVFADPLIHTEGPLSAEAAERGREATALAANDSTDPGGDLARQSAEETVIFFGALVMGLLLADQL